MPGWPEGPLHWDAPGMGALAAALAGGIVGLLAVRSLARRTGARRVPVAIAAAARGVAVALLVLAVVGGPHVIRAAARPGVVVRTAGGPSAALRLETFRGAAPTDRPADLVLDIDVDGDGDGALAPSDALVRALRPGEPRPAIVATGVGTAGVLPAAPAAIARVLAPGGISEGVPARLTLEAVGEAFGGTSATVRIEGLDAVVCDLPADTRRVSIALPPLSAGDHLVRVDADGHSTALAFLHVRTAPRVVVIADGAAGDLPLVTALLRQGLDVRALEPAAAAAADLGTTDVVALGPGAGDPVLDARIAARVEKGTGLLVLGGRGPAGLRRHAGGPLEALLPVTLPEAPPPPPPPPPPPIEPPPPPPPVEPPTEPEAPEVALDDGPKDAYRVSLLLIVDRSGSMTGPKMDLARMAAVAAARTLAPEDRVGVLAFDDEPQWIAPFQDAGDIRRLIGRLGGLRPNGGTDFHPALRVGFAAILKERTAIRHVILLSDGATRAAVFMPLVESAARQKVTLSTVAIGDGADTRLLGLLAGWGGGRLYLATDPARLPEVVTLDATRFTVAERDRLRADALERAEGLPTAPPTETPIETPPETEPPLVEPPIVEPQPADPEPPKPDVVPPRAPRVVAGAVFLTGFEDASWPLLAHPEEPRRRPGGHVVLAWEGDAPALVIGRAGPARVAVVAADIASSDARDFHAWDQGGRALAQLVRALATPAQETAAALVGSVRPALDGSATVVLPTALEGVLRLEKADSGDGGPRPAQRLEVRMESASEGSVAGRLSATPAPGTLVGLFTPLREGAPPRRVALVSPGPARTALWDAHDLAAAADLAVVARPPAPRDGLPERRREPGDTPLLAGAAALLLLEAAARRAV